MENKPPPLPGAKKVRVALMLNVFLPGAGLLYLGRRLSGAVVMAGFLFCLLLALGIFLVGYFRYFQLTLGGNILEGDNLEQIGTVFHPRWLIGLAIAGGVIHVISMVLLAAAKRKLEPKR